MLETALCLLAAHLVADFVVQTKWIVDHKTGWAGMMIHIALVAATVGIALGSASPLPIIAIAAPHLAMDLWKTHRMDDKWRAFVLDQAVHIAVIVAVAAALPTAYADGTWAALPSEQQQGYLTTLVALAGLIAAVPAGGFLIGKLMDPLDAHKPSEEGIPDGGRYIGWLERGLILLFILVGHPEGVGLLLAAKSILRFNEVKTANIRAHTEYVIIGTLLSFAWALGVAALTEIGLRHWG